MASTVSASAGRASRRSKISRAAPRGAAASDALPSLHRQRARPKVGVPLFVGHAEPAPSLGDGGEALGGRLVIAARLRAQRGGARQRDVARWQ